MTEDNNAVHSKKKMENEGPSVRKVVKYAMVYVYLGHLCSD